MKFKFYPQKDQMDCGPACLAMISYFYGQKYPIEYLRENSFLTKDGVSLLGITEAAQKIGMHTLSTRINKEELKKNIELFPAILHWNQNHFVVLIKIYKKKFSKKTIYKIADPDYGIINISEENFLKSWLAPDHLGVALFLVPTDKFYQITPPTLPKLPLKFILRQIKDYKKQMIFLFLLLLLNSIITFLFPFLTQFLIDKGVNLKNLHFINFIILAQVFLFLGSLIIEIIRNWLLLIVGSKLSINIISIFFKKLLQLPLKFFDTKLIGDFNQRITDNERIESFLTSQSLLTFFSILSFSVFFFILGYYNYTILMLYLVSTIISIIWSLYWLRKRKPLDYYHFQYKSISQQVFYEMINGVVEMKLNDFDDFKRKEWERVQRKLLKINIRILKIDQIQLSGFEFINQLKNILVTFLAAILVVKGSLTLGVMLSISYIIGQMNSPVNQLVSFFRSLQDAKLSLGRLSEIQLHPMEEQEDQKKIPEHSDHVFNPGILIQNLSFQYEGPHSKYILKDINLFIPEGKVTAIVGESGSGKTTLLKLLLKFYKPSQGNIFYNGVSLQNISAKNLRKNSGVVMQEGFIFSDTIQRNIVTADENIDLEKFNQAIQIANIQDFIESFPMKFYTKIGASGNGISGGQKQRILIARAVYKQPQYMFFDEATSSLDAGNERIIQDQLQKFFKGKTVIIIAHRLSTVKNADQIIVLKQGKIVEQGTHPQLVANKSVYFNLVKNQLELGG